MEVPELDQLPDLFCQICNLTLYFSAETHLEQNFSADVNRGQPEKKGNNIIACCLIMHVKQKNKTIKQAWCSTD